MKGTNYQNATASASASVACALCLRRMCKSACSDHFRLRGAKPAEKRSLVVVTLKSWSQMLFRKIQESQQTMLSTSLTVKKVMSRL